jgi:hypothetical protein
MTACLAGGGTDARQGDRGFGMFGAVLGNMLGAMLGPMFGARFGAITPAAISG